MIYKYNINHLTYNKMFIKTFKPLGRLPRIYNTATFDNAAVSLSYGFNNYPIKNIEPTIINKSNNMERIRLASIDAINLTNNIDNTKKQHYIEFLHTYPAWFNFPFFSKSSAQNPYGHTSLCFYRTEGNQVMEDDIANVGTRMSNGIIDKTKFMHFISSQKYLFNNKEENIGLAGNQQGGLLERSFIGINIPIDENKWSELKDFYKSVQCQCNSGNAKFTMGLHIITNAFRWLYPFKERGNCCYWTSKGLVKIDLLKSPSHFPMVCFYKFLINVLRQQNNKYCITFYEGQHHKNLPNGSFMYPFFWIRNKYDKIWKTELMANVYISLTTTRDSSNNYLLNVNIKTLDKKKAQEYVSKMTQYVKSII